MKALANQAWTMVEGTMWSIPTRALLRREVRTCVPRGAVRGALQWIYEVKERCHQNSG